MVRELGAFKKLEVRDIWTNESSDFTPWLTQEENLSRLSEAIGLELELRLMMLESNCQWRGIPELARCVGRTSPDRHNCGNWDKNRSSVFRPGPSVDPLVETNAAKAACPSCRFSD